MLPPNKTRIVATIGPASSSLEVLEQMIHAGILREALESLNLK